RSSDACQVIEASGAAQASQAAEEAFEGFGVAGGVEGLDDFRLIEGMRQARRVAARAAAVELSLLAELQARRLRPPHQQDTPGQQDTSDGQGVSTPGVLGVDAVGFLIDEVAAALTLT